MFWSCIDLAVFEFKVSNGIVPFRTIGVDSADTDNHPQWRLTWTINIYFEIIKPGSSTDTPLYQERRLMYQKRQRILLIGQLDIVKYLHWQGKS